MEGKNVGRTCRKCGRTRQEEDAAPYEECPFCCTEYDSYEATLQKLAPATVTPRRASGLLWIVAGLLAVLMGYGVIVMNFWGERKVMEHKLINACRNVIGDGLNDPDSMRVFDIEVLGPAPIDGDELQRYLQELDRQGLSSLRPSVEAGRFVPEITYITFDMGSKNRMGGMVRQKAFCRYEQTSIAGDQADATLKYAELSGELVPLKIREKWLFVGAPTWIERLRYPFDRNN